MCTWVAIWDIRNVWFFFSFLCFFFEILMKSLLSPEKIDGKMQRARPLRSRVEEIDLIIFNFQKKNSFLQINSKIKFKYCISISSVVQLGWNSEQEWGGLEEIFTEEIFREISKTVQDSKFSENSRYFSIWHKLPYVG